MPRRTPLAVVALAALLLGACGDDSGGTDAGDGTAAATDGTAAAAAADDPALDGVTVEGAFGEAPTLEFDTPFETDETIRRVLEEGDGDVLEQGMTVSFEHVAVNGRDGSEFDNSFETQPGSTVLDPTQTIPGLVAGLVGVPIGSRVLMALSPADSFQERGGIPDVGVEADDSTLFVVDVLDASVPLTRAEGTPVEPEPGLPTVELDADGKPTITLPSGDPPAELVTQPLIEGEGDDVESGQTITVHYTGIIWPGGEQFDSSWDRGEPATFQIGVGAVIPGWDEGLVGQPVGSQVLLVIPPDQGYGPEGNPSAGIEGTDTLVFVVDILDAV
jgi:FKBP-type peptidyl-prolyl cis-trans isomerase